MIAAACAQVRLEDLVLVRSQPCQREHDMLKVCCEFELLANNDLHEDAHAF